MKTVPAAELNACSQFSQRTFAEALGNGRHAPFPVVRDATLELRCQTLKGRFWSRRFVELRTKL